MNAKKSAAYKNLVRKMQERYPRFGECAAELYAHFIAEKNFDKFALDETLSKNNLPKIFY